MSRTPPVVLAAVLLTAGCTSVPTAQERLQAACAAGDAASCAAADVVGDAAAEAPAPVRRTSSPAVVHDPRVGVGVSSEGGVGIGLGIGVGHAHIGATTGNRWNDPWRGYGSFGF